MFNLNVTNVDIPNKYFLHVMYLMKSLPDNTTDFKKPHLRATFRTSYPLFIALFIALIVVSMFANSWMIMQILREKKRRESFYIYLFVNCLNDIFKLLVVMPTSILTLFVLNSTFGSFFCHSVTIIHDYPFYLTLLTFVLIACDRYRFIMNPLERRLPPFACLAGICILTGILVLPYAVYTDYVDLQKALGPQIGFMFEGTGLCLINLANNIQEYIRGLFIVLYVLPVALVTYLHVRVSGEIKSQETSLSLALHETNRRESGEENSVCSVTSSMVTDSVYNARTCAVFPVSTRDAAILQHKHDDNEEREYSSGYYGVSKTAEDNIDWAREKQTQNTLMMMVTVYAVCLLPLNVLRLIKHVIHEGPEHSRHYDLAFVFVVLIAFLPTLGTPYLFRVWYYSTRTTVDACHYNQLRRLSGTSSVGNRDKSRNNSKS